MKNLATLLCIILCLNACKKSQDNLPVTATSLPGTWFLKTSSTISYTDGVPATTNTYNYNTTDVGFGNPDLAIYFNSNLTGTYLQPGLNGVPFTYLISGDHLALNYGSDGNLPTSFTIKSLTNTQLELLVGTASANGMVYDYIYTKN